MPSRNEALPVGGGSSGVTLESERALADCGYDVVVGFDEVGRGALAGPVMVGAAAVWSRDMRTLGIPEGVADSKLLTERRREALYDGLASWCAAYAVGQCGNDDIDSWGITHALGIAALRALHEVERRLGVVAQRGAVEGAGASRNAACPARPVRVGAILDGPYDYITKACGTFEAPDVPVPAHVVTMVKADRICATVAAASILAKVTRDRLMVGLAHSDPRYRPYAWDRNKGYGSPSHRQAIRDHGQTPLHRHSWHMA